MEGAPPAAYVYESDEYRRGDTDGIRGKYNCHRPHGAAERLDVAPLVADASMELKPTTTRDFGPFFVQLGPFRGTLLPMGIVGAVPGASPQPGDALLVRGVVYGAQSRAGLPYATLDVWQGADGMRSHGFPSWLTIPLQWGPMPSTITPNPTACSSHT